MTDPSKTLSGFVEKHKRTEMHLRIFIFFHPNILLKNYQKGGSLNVSPL